MAGHGLCTTAGRSVSMNNASQSSPSHAESNTIEDRVVAFAHQLGWIVGTAQARTEGWLERTRLSEELTRIRDEASSLLSYLQSGSREDAAKHRTAAENRSTAADPAHAPGKRHRKPLPSQRGVKHSNQQVAKAKRASMRGPRGRG